MKKVLLNKIIDLEAIEATPFDESVENDIFCIDVHDNDYWVYYKRKSGDHIYLGSSPVAYGAIDIMTSFVYGCFYTTINEIKYDSEEYKDEEDKW